MMETFITQTITTLFDDHPHIMGLPVITWLFISIVLFLVVNVIIENHQFNTWQRQLHVGTKLQHLSKIIDDEFDEGYMFTITIIQLGDKQVKVQYSDGSKRTYDKYFLYHEGWKILDETINEN